MALNVREKFGTNIGVGLTGVAGPGAHDDRACRNCLDWFQYC